MKRHRKTKAGAGIVMLLTVLLITPFSVQASDFEVWPANTRFKVNYSGTPNNPNDDMVLDTDTNLVWTRNVNLSGYLSKENAINYCNNLVLGVCECNPAPPVYANWRLPSNRRVPNHVWGYMWWLGLLAMRASIYRIGPVVIPSSGPTAIWEQQPHYCSYFAKIAVNALVVVT